MARPSSVSIRGVGAYVPAKRVTNDELATSVDTSDEWIRSHTGIGSRHLAADGEATSDLAVAAVKNLLERNNLELDSIDGIVLATATQDFPGFPATACVIQHKLGLDKIPAFDIMAGCTGFIYAIEVAKGLMGGGRLKRMLVIGAEKLSAVTDWTDRNTCVLFGDGAGCVLLEASDELNVGVLDSVLHAEGSGAQYLSIPRGGTCDPFLGDSHVQERKLQMDGRAVYNFAVRALGETIEELLARNSVTVDDIDWIIPHQANSRIIQAAAKRLKISLDKFFVNIESYANTSAASIPIAMKDMEDQGLLKKGHLVLTVGFGAGLTNGGNLIIW